MLRSLLLSGLLLGCACHAAAQDATGSIRGQVVSLKEGHPVPAVFVTATPLGARREQSVTRTDSAGVFTFHDLPPGGYMLRLLATAPHAGGSEVVRVRSGEEVFEEVVATPPNFDAVTRERQLFDAEQSRQTWDAETGPRYRFRVRSRCFCFAPSGPWTIAVDHDSSAMVRGPDGTDPPERARTIEALFDWLETMLHDPNLAVEVQYHPRLGYPESIKVLADPYATDAGFEISIDRVRPEP